MNNFLARFHGKDDIVHVHGYGSKHGTLYEACLEGNVGRCVGNKAVTVLSMTRGFDFVKKAVLRLWR